MMCSILLSLFFPSSARTFCVKTRLAARSAAHTNREEMVRFLIEFLSCVQGLLKVEATPESLGRSSYKRDYIAIKTELIARSMISRTLPGTLPCGVAPHPGKDRGKGEPKIRGKSGSVRGLDSASRT